jgi:hypothetical protein
MNRPTTVNTPIGPVELDSKGAAIGAARMDPNQVYTNMPDLLKEFINSGDQKKWNEIRLKIDAIYHGLTCALNALDDKTAFSRDISARVKKGQKLLFKPNIVSPSCIDRVTHGPGIGSIAACTNWYFVAALMRWFHDKLGVTYHQMSLGEGGTTMSATAAGYTLSLQGKGNVTTEAVLEGKWGNSYGGWGFYFVRKYLADTHLPGHSDDPMKGFDESIAGACIPPGEADGKLLIYDINKIAIDGSNGRDVPVAHGVNFSTITLHKAIIGGNQANPADIKAWPGCVLINVPRLKIHNLEIITGAIKNLGVGLYPMEAQDKNYGTQTHWKYAHPHKANPALKSGIPHSVWVSDVDEDTGLPRLDAHGVLVLKKTGGLSGTMADVIEAVKNQNIMMLHVVDAIAPTSRYHAGAAMLPVPEGYAFASLDPVALDLLCARYLFTTVPMEQAKLLQNEKNMSVGFFQKVPVPERNGRSIVPVDGYDSPVSRYKGFAYCQTRGLGIQEYYVVGQDVWHGGDLASVGGHLGQINNGMFTELLTKEMYFAATKPLLDLQATTLAYARANDAITGSSYTQFLWSFDENGDGVMDYDEKFKGRTTHFMSHGSRMQSVSLAIPERLRIGFLLTAVLLRCTKKEWNPAGHDFNNWPEFNLVVTTAIAMAQAPVENTDPFVSGLVWGKGKWPSIQFAEWRHTCNQIYGARFPVNFDIMPGLYGTAFQYTDIKFNKAARISGGGDILTAYHRDIEQGAHLLPFTLFVPLGYGKVGSKNIPNVEETDNPKLIFTARFDDGREEWRELSLSSIP